MPWQDRLRQAAYTSPSEIRTVFDYTNVGLSVEKKTTAFEFPDADGTFVQDLGPSGRRYPLRLFFSGDDYDLVSNAFLETLLEIGPGKLEHPIYGAITVVPFGEIKRRDDLVTAANQAVFDVTFWDTIGTLYPTAQTDPGSEVLNAVSEYDDAAADEFQEFTDLDNAVEQANFKAVYQNLLGAAETGLRAVADTQENVQQQFDAIVDSINTGIDILVEQPLALAFQTTLMIQAPARALTSITARLDAYKNLTNSLITGNGAVLPPSVGSENSNKFHTRDLYASTYIAASMIAVVNNQFATKPEAIAAADEILSQFEAVTAWRDDNFQSLSEIDTGGAYQQLQEAVALTAGFLVEVSFSLAQEHIIVLDRARTIVDLSAEIYGSVDDRLDFLINSNDLSGSEILELPRGKEIKYYI